MKFKKYLNEKDFINDELEDIVEKIQKDCKSYLKSGLILYRGMPKDKYKAGTFNHMKVRKNRKPKDMAPVIHDMLDNAFKERFGWKARSEGVFCTSQLKAAYYGNPFIIFPIGKWEILYNPEISDSMASLYTYITKKTGIDASLNSLNYDPINYIEVKNLMPGWIKQYKTSVSGLKPAMKKVEVILRCKSYYALSKTYKYYKEIMEEVY